MVETNCVLSMTPFYVYPMAHIHSSPCSLQNTMHCKWSQWNTPRISCPWSDPVTGLIRHLGKAWYWIPKPTTNYFEMTSPTNFSFVVKLLNMFFQKYWWCIIQTQHWNCTEQNGYVKPKRTATHSDMKSVKPGSSIFCIGTTWKHVLGSLEPLHHLVEDATLCRLHLGGHGQRTKCRFSFNQSPGKWYWYVWNYLKTLFWRAEVGDVMAQIFGHSHFTRCFTAPADPGTWHLNKIQCCLVTFFSFVKQPLKMRTEWDFRNPSKIWRLLGMLHQNNWRNGRQGEQLLLPGSCVLPLVAMVSWCFLLLSVQVIRPMKKPVGSEPCWIGNPSIDLQMVHFA